MLIECSALQSAGDRYAQPLSSPRNLKMLMARDLLYLHMHEITRLDCKGWTLISLAGAAQYKKSI